MIVGCGSCNWSGGIAGPATTMGALHKCPRCECPVTSVDISGWSDWIRQYVNNRETQRKKGEIGTRRQSPKESDAKISGDGIGAELAACLILAPWQIKKWQSIAYKSGPNRGSDLPAAWFTDGRPVEVKYTARRNGHLLVRPPRNTPGPMKADYIDDSIYVMMTSERDSYSYIAVGWAERNDFLRKGKPNPIKRGLGQRECWGIQAKLLHSMESLFPILFRKN